MDNKEKLERVKDLLNEREVAYKENHRSRRCGVVIDLVIPKYQIAIFCGGSDFNFKKVTGIYAPLFIRDEESVEFVLVKVTNLLSVQEKFYKTPEERRAIKEERRLYTIECERRHQERLERRLAHERRLALKEQKAKEVQKKKRKRIRVVRYEHV